MPNRIITISRQCGSGGHTIGKTLAERLGVPFYDKSIIELVAQRSGLTVDTVENHGEYRTPSLLYNIARAFSPTFTPGDKSVLPLQEQVTAYQTELIRELADKGPCVIVGRCADYILRDRPDCFHVFLCGKLEDRAQRVIHEHNIPPAEAQRHVKTRDAKRAKNYNYITDRMWGDARNYHLCLDSSCFGIDRCVEIIETYSQL